MSVKIHESWKRVLEDEFNKPYWSELTTRIKEEYTHTPCAPNPKDIFKAFHITPFDQVKVVILGQDPYHTPGAAMGMSFSVPNENPKPQPSLKNIFKELATDMGVTRTQTDLTDWAEQWVLLLNAVLTVEIGKPASHAGFGWEQFTDCVIEKVSKEREHVVFILWGKYAQSKKILIDTSKHLVIESAHPSPFSVERGFYGSKPFSRANEFLIGHNLTPINWGK